MGKFKEKWVKPQQSKKDGLGGLYGSSNDLASRLEMCYPKFREYIHQAADHNELDKVIDLIFSVKIEGES